MAAAFVGSESEEKLQAKKDGYDNLTTSTQHTFIQGASECPREEERGAWVGWKLMSMPKAHGTRHTARDKHNYSWNNVP